LLRRRRGEKAKDDLTILDLHHSRAGVPSGTNKIKSLQISFAHHRRDRLSRRVDNAGIHKSAACTIRNRLC